MDRWSTPVLHNDALPALSEGGALVKHAPANLKGRDFVVGDLHGCANTLRYFLNDIQFNTSVDRLFSTGNLFDRGPESLLSLKLLKEPWFFAVRGAHETLLLAHLWDPEKHSPYDATWLKQAIPSKADHNRFRQAWLPRLQKLPLVWAVDGPKRFNVVHAEILEEGRSVTDARIDTWAFDDPEWTAEKCVWGRSLLTSYQKGRPVRRAHDPEKCSPIYCGRTVMPAVMQVGGQIYLNRGGYLAYNPDFPATQFKDPTVPFEFEPGIGIAEPNMDRYWFVSTVMERPPHIVPLHVADVR